LTRRRRTAFFIPMAALLGIVLVFGLAHLPDFGHYKGPYGKVLNDLAVTQRHATDIVTAINFDYRAFDTLGEEFILFASVVGVMLLLREMRGEQERPEEGAAEEHEFARGSEALRALSLILVGPMVVLGIYIVAHGHITPGGGFQGGLVLAAGPLLVFVAGGYIALTRVAPHTMVELAESGGAAGFALIGVGALVFAGTFFKNFIELGPPGQLLSAGTIPVASIAVGFEVTGAFLLIWAELMDQALVVRGE
jgi:multicomponent Na+:H+ antiporter subunit B